MTITTCGPRISALALCTLLAACGGGASDVGSSPELGQLRVATGVSSTATVEVNAAAALSIDSVDLVDQAGLVPANPLATPAIAGRFDATTVSADGSVIAFTVYVPEIAAGNSAPLVLEGHGWGGKRTRDLDTKAYDALANTPLQTAKLALDSGVQGGKKPSRGWYVISFDQRGFGESGGFANVMDPEIEGRDVSAIIDWARLNLAALALRKNASGAMQAVVGAVGLSYGGGFQTIGAGVDKRIGAIVPTTTWNDMRYSLYDTPKSEYLSLLLAVGVAGKGRVESFAYQGLVDANTTGQVSADFSRRMYEHSPVSYCQGDSTAMRQPGIPAFFIQASNDILFNLNEGIDSFQCYRKNNRKSKFMAVRFGHPDVLINNSMPKFTEENVACSGAGNASISVARLAFSFLSQNLVDSRLDARRAPDYLTIPDLRAVLEDGNVTSGVKGETAEGRCYEVASLSGSNNGSASIQRGGTTLPAVPGTITELLTGLPAPLASLITPGDPAALDSPALKAFVGPEAGQVLPLSMPFNIDRALLGTPTVRLSIAAVVAAETTPLNPPTIFVGLVRRSADGRQQLVHNQVQLVKGFGDHDITLPGVSMLLHGNETLALVVYGFHPQYFNNYTRIPLSVNVTGIQAALPFVN
jgi:ABC-2 type transport system ATP-binding protein